MNPTAVLVLASAPAVVAAVAAAETAGLPSKFAPLAAFFIALAGALADTAAQLYPQATPWIQAAGVAVAITITAVGGHTVVTGYLANQSQPTPAPAPTPLTLPATTSEPPAA